MVTTESGIRLLSVAVELDHKTFSVLNDEAQRSGLEIKPFLELVLKQRAIAALHYAEPGPLEDIFAKGDTHNGGVKLAVP
jgi:hypothetical protein